MSAHARYTIDCEDAPRQSTAAYLRVGGDECAFVETYTSHATPRLLDALVSVGRRPEDVRFVVVTHAHLDHAAGASALLRACPNATLLAHPRTARHMVDPAKLVASATSVYGPARFAQLYGVIEPIPEERVRALEDGETFDLGGATLRVHHTAGHANHHFIVHDPATEAVFTGDTFGLVYPALQTRGRFAIPSTSPTGFDPTEARRSVDKVVALGEAAACPTHFGEVRHIEEVARQLHAWIDRAEAWLDDATRSDEDERAITERLERVWREAISAEATSRGLGFDEAAFRLLAMDIELNAQGMAFVAVQRRTKAKARS